MISIKSLEQLYLIKESSQLVYKMLALEIYPGFNITIFRQIGLKNLDRDHGVIPAFIGLYDFPNTLC